jgi:hypothetical protein
LSYINSLKIPSTLDFRDHFVRSPRGASAKQSLRKPKNRANVSVEERRPYPWLWGAAFGLRMRTGTASSAKVRRRAISRTRLRFATMTNVILNSIDDVVLPKRSKVLVHAAHGESFLRRPTN